MQTIGTVLIDVKADTQKLVTGMEQAQRKVEQTSQAMKNAVLGVATAYLSFEGVNAFTSMIKGSIDAADSLSEVAEKLALSTNELSRLEYAAGFAGVSIGQLDAAMSAMIRRTGNFKSDGTGAAVKAMEALGISVEYAKEHFTDTNTTFNLLIDRLSKVEDSTLRTKIAQDLFSKSAAGIVRMANMGAEEIKRLGDQGERLGAIISDEFADQAGAVNDQLDRLNHAFGGVSNTLASEFAPMMISSAESIEKNLPLIIDTAKEITHLAIVLGSTTLAFKAFNTTIVVYNLLQKELIPAAKTTTIVVDTMGQAVVQNTLRLKAATIATKALNTALKASPFAIVAGAIYTISNSLIDANERLETFNQTLDKTNDAVNIRNKDRLEEVKKQLAELDERSKNWTLEQKQIQGVGSAYAMLYKEKSILEQNIKLYEERNKKQNESTASKGSGSSSEKKNLEDILNIHDEIVKVLDPRLAETSKINKKYDDMKLKLIELNGAESALFDLEKARAKELENINKKYEAPEVTVHGIDEFYQKQADLASQALSAIETPLEKVNDKFLEMHDVVKDIFDTEQLEKFYKVWQKEIEDTLDKSEKYEGVGSKDWTAGLSGTAKDIANIGNAIADLSTEQEQWNKFSSEQTATEADKNQHLQNQIGLWGNVAGSISSMASQGSAAAKTAQVAQTALAVAQGVSAILNQGTGDPYTAIPRIVAMTAMVAATLSNIGVSFGGGSKTVSYVDEFSAQAENIGTGTVLGDSSAASESIKNSLETLEDYARPEFQLLSSMNDSLISIDQAIGGVSGNIMRSGSDLLGEGFTPSAITIQNNESLVSAISSVPIVGGLLGGLAGSLFGKTKVAQTLTDAGINISSQLITSAIDNINAQSYETIFTAIKKSSWGSSKLTTYTTSSFDKLDTEIANQFELVLGTLYDTVVLGGTALGLAEDNIIDDLSDFEVEIGKISLMDKTADEIEEQLQNVFGQVGDKLVDDALNGTLDDFQQIGEGLLDTLTRVAVGVQEADYYIGRLGNGYEETFYTDIVNTQGDVGFEALSQSIIKADEAVYGLDNGVVQMIETMNTSAEDLYETYMLFESVRGILKLAGQDAGNLSSSMLLGAGGIEELSSAMEDYYDEMLSEEQRVQYTYANLSEEFDKLNLSMPETTQGFVDIVSSIDTASEDGAELFGRVVILTDQFSELVEMQQDLFESRRDTEIMLWELEQEAVETQITSVKELSTSFNTMFNSVEDTITTLLGNIDGGTQDALISKFWDVRSQIDALLAKEGDLSTSEQTKLSELVSDIQTLSTNIQSSTTGDNTDITNNLVSELSYIQDALDLTDEILQVNIVSSSDDFINGLSATQAALLSSALTDDIISKDEYLGLSLSDLQKDLISQILTDSDTAGVLSALQSSSSTDPLSLSSFEYGIDSLSAANKVDFYKSFDAPLETLEAEAQTLAKNLQYLVIFPEKTQELLEQLDSTDYGNVFEFFTSMGLTLPSYDVGTPYVPYDQTANIHQGEIILDASSSNILRKYGIQANIPTININTKSLENKIDELTDITIAQANEIKKMRKEITDMREGA